MVKTFQPTLFQHLATDYRRNLAVTAGAGTGKTEVLTRRIIRILARERLGLDRLLVLTFTDKAAVEMKERIYLAIEGELDGTRGRAASETGEASDPYGSGDPHFQKLKDTFLNNYISTFHAFCAALLREYPIEAGIDPYFRILDETDKVFFLRRSINRSIRELASDKNNADIHVLSGEFSRTALANILFTIIQKRETTGRWIAELGGTDWETYRERLPELRDCMVREMAYKLHRSGEPAACLEALESVAPSAAEGGSTLNDRRLNLISSVSALMGEIARVAVGPVDAERITGIKAEIAGHLRIPGKIPKSWSEEAFFTLKEAMLRLRHLLRSFSIEDFEITLSHEEAGFELLKALARLAEYSLRAYHRDKAEANYLDFQDLQLMVLRLLTGGRHRHILDELQERFLFIMIDEFQDTNDLQWRIIHRIAADRSGTVVKPKLFIVGDEKQAIYSFRGGDVCLFSRVRRELIQANRVCRHDSRPFDLISNRGFDYQAEYRRQGPEMHLTQAGEIVFADNFRSAEVPINFINLFFHDLLRREVYEDYDARPQVLRCSGNKTRGSVELLLVDTERETEDEALEAGSGEESGGTSRDGEPDLDPHMQEALLIADKIRDVFFGEDERYARVRGNARAGRPAVAILLNRRTMIKTYEEALRMNRIEFTVVRGRGFYQRQEIVDLGNLLDFLADPASDRPLVAFLRSPEGNVSDEGIFLLSRTIEGATLWEKLSIFAGPDLELAEGSGAESDPGLSPPDREALRRAAARLSGWLELSGRMPLTELLRRVLDEGGYAAGLSRGARGDQAVSNVEKLLDSARELMLAEGGDLAAFAAWLSNRIEYIEEEGEADIDLSLGGAVQIMTVHQSKGLEFPLVFVPDLGAGFNLGERESLVADSVPLEMTVTDSGIARRERMEIGIDAPNPEQDWEAQPLLSKRIIKKRLRDKLIAEKKRLLYVAATRAMDHLILVGHSRFSSAAVVERVRFAPLDQLTNWMDWINRMLGLSFLGDGLRGEIEYGNEAGPPMKIPYRWFTAEGGPGGADEEYRTEFPVGE